MNATPKTTPKANVIAKTTEAFVAELPESLLSRSAWEGETVGDEEEVVVVVVVLGVRPLRRE